jgi:hypothetical protein
VSRKQLTSLTPDLAALAATLPTQHVAASAPAPKRISREQVIQLNLRVRAQLRKELHRLANDADMTVCAFVLEALRAKGLTVRDEDLIDRRR